MRHDLGRRDGPQTRRRVWTGVAAAVAVGLGALAVFGRPSRPQSTYVNAGAVSQDVPELVYFNCDWPDVGSSRDSFMGSTCDTPFTTWNTNGQNVVVATSRSGLAFPTANYLDMRAGTGDDAWIEIGFGEEYVPVVPVGDSLGGRMYFAITLPQAEFSPNTTHGHYHWPAFGWGPGVLGFDLWMGPGGCQADFCGADEYQFVVWPGADTHQAGEGAYPHASPGGAGNPLVRNTAYRIEWLYIRTGTAAYQLRTRIYDSTGTLLSSSDNANAFVNIGWGGGETLNGQTFTGLADAGASGMRSWIIGNNGFENEPPTFTSAFAYAAMAICSAWCGPYPISGVEN